MLLFSISQTPSLDEIVFEHRNRAYGAFVLRRDYNRRVLIAFLITASLLLTVTGTVFYRFFRTHVPSFSVPPAGPVILEQKIFEFQETKKKTAGPAAAQPEQAGSNQNKSNLPPVVVDSLPAVDPENNKPADTLAYNAHGTGKPGDVDPISRSGTDTGIPGNDPEIEKVKDYVEVMPEFPGGDEMLFRFLRDKLRFPRGEHKSTTVYVSFVVNADGGIGSVEILRSGGESYDNEVIRVVNKMPRWKPGRQGDQFVAVRYKMPVTFRVLP